MKKFVTMANILFIVLIAVILCPGRKPTHPAAAFLIAAGMIEILSLIPMARGKNARAASDIAAMVYIFLLIWEIWVTKLNLGHRILAPAPENVFYAFYEQRALMLRGLLSSLRLLGLGFGFGLGLAVPLGLFVGWIPRLRDMLLPAARIISPIPPIVYTPYLVAVMPTFRSASVMVLVLGIFFPMFMNMILRLKSVDPMVMNAARMLNLNARQMVTKILLPYLLPGIFANIKILLSTSFMALTFAEMMGATSGLGYFIKNFSDYGNYTNVAAGILLVAIVVTALNGGVAFLERRVIRWQ